jgi:hypothetical protein
MEEIFTRVDEMVRQYKRVFELYPEVTRQRLLDSGLAEGRIWLLDRLSECTESQIDYLQKKHGSFKALHEAMERGEEFSKNAQEAYRANWLAWQKENRKEVKQALEEAMDRLQVAIAPGPGPVWDGFVATLPGYREHWAMLTIEEELTSGDADGGG